MDPSIIDNIINVIKENKGENYGSLWNTQGVNLSFDPEITKATLPIFGAVPFCGGFLEDLDPLSMEINSTYLSLLFGVQHSRANIVSSLCSRANNDDTWDEKNRKSIAENLLKNHSEVFEYIVPFNSVGKIPHFLINDEICSQNVVTTLGSVKSAYVLSNLIKNKVLNPSSKLTTRVLEIGAGYGSQCETLLTYSLNKEIPMQYVICDIPSTLLYSYYYISSTFPHIDCIFIDTKEAFSANRAKILNEKNNYVVFILPELLFLFKEQRFTLAYNSESFLEMSKDHLDGYLKFIFQSIDVENFCSRNRKWRYDEENKRVHEEVQSYIPTDWEVISFEEDFLLDQPHIKQMGRNGRISSIENIFARQK